MKVAICLIIRNENQYLPEWLDHHRKLGFNHFFIYDNMSDYSVWKYLQDYSDKMTEGIQIKIWDDNEIATQQRAYLDCCKKNSDYDYIAFIDTDEFVQLKGFNTIQEFIEHQIEKRGNFEGISMYWRFYGENFENRHPIEDYKHYHENGHTKSIVNPKSVIEWRDPHLPITKLGHIINELGNISTSPIGNHTSKNIWIKHIWCRSLPEFKEKMIRGRGDKVPHTYDLDTFYSYNSQCIISDDDK